MYVEVYILIFLKQAFPTAVSLQKFLNQVITPAFSSKESGVCEKELGTFEYEVRSFCYPCLQEISKDFFYLSIMRDMKNLHFWLHLSLLALP